MILFINIFKWFKNGVLKLSCLRGYICIIFEFRRSVIIQFKSTGKKFIHTKFSKSWTSCTWALQNLFFLIHKHFIYFDLGAIFNFKSRNAIKLIYLLVTVVIDRDNLSVTTQKIKRCYHEHVNYSTIKIHEKAYFDVVWELLA